MALFKWVTFVIFPIIRVSGFPFPISSLFVLTRRKLVFFKEYFYPLFFSSLYLLFVICLNNLTTGIELSDLAYFVFPLIYLLLIHVFYKIKNLEKVIKVYFFINIAIVILTGIFNYVPGFLIAYYDSYLFGNITSESHYLNIISNRGIGLLGHPAWFGLMSYLLGKFLSIKENKYRYILFSFVAISLSGARAALFILLLTELLSLFIKHRKNLAKLYGFLVIFFIAALVGFYLIYNNNDSFRFWIDITMADIKYGNEFRSDSISHRLEMFSMLFKNNLISLMFGGGIFSTSINILKTDIAIDSELVLRTLQYGLLGYILLFLPPLIALRRAKKITNKMGIEMTRFIIFFALLGSLTTTVMSNMIFIIYISIIIAVVEQRNENVKNKTGNKHSEQRAS